MPLKNLTLGKQSSPVPVQGAKICGLREPEAVLSAVHAGAAMIGFVFFAKSPRNISPLQTRELTKLIPDPILRTGLFVDRKPQEILLIARKANLNAIQLCGTCNAAEINYIKEHSDHLIIQANGISTARDFETLDWKALELVDYLLFDAKPPQGSDRPGGNALAFDWSLLKQQRFNKPWLLAGGLSADNVTRAMQISGAQLVDVSSGVEFRPGFKDPMRIKAFIKEVNKQIAVSQPI